MKLIAVTLAAIIVTGCTIHVNETSTGTTQTVSHVVAGLGMLLATALVTATVIHLKGDRQWLTYDD